ncbi:MAG: nitroreductase [Actinobacteria bacterium]|nr:nitroreductase [Actinomycetota bacterium]
MKLPVDSWYAALHDRHSWRAYQERGLENDKLTAMREVCSGMSGQGARAEVSTRNLEYIFRGVIGSYGSVTGASAYAAFIGDLDDPNVQEKVGYMGEGIVLEAVARGLSTCWVGGYFRPEAVANDIPVGENESVIAVTPLGYRTETASINDRVLKSVAKSRTRKPLAELCSGLPQQEWQPWMKGALEAARIAPSAVNRQPWRFEVAGDGITVSAAKQKSSSRISERLDCGIAMLHLELGARHAGAQASWEFLEAPQVARLRFG